MWWAPQFLKQIFPCELEKVICHQDGASFQSKNPTSPNREPHLLWGSPWPAEERWELQVAVREEASQVSLEGTGEAIGGPSARKQWGQVVLLYTWLRDREQQRSPL